MEKWIYIHNREISTIERKKSNTDYKLITGNRKSYRKVPDARRSPESPSSFTASPNTAALKNVPIKHIPEQEQGTPGNSFTIR